MVAGQQENVAESVVLEALEVLADWESGRSLPDSMRHGGGGLLANGLLTYFRRKAEIEWLLARFVTKPPRPPVRRLLGWTLCQLLYVSEVPAPLICNLAVHLTRQYGTHSEAGFVNAVLRRLGTEGRENLLALIQKEAPPPVRLGFSGRLHEAWCKRFTPAELQALAELLRQPAPVVARRRKTHVVDTAACSFLQPLPGLDWVASEQLFEVTDPPAFFACWQFATGAFYVQDPSTLLAPALLAVKPGEIVADLCAAPGGKAVLLAEAMGLQYVAAGSATATTPPGGVPAGAPVLLCSDRSAQRLQRLRENLAGFSGLSCDVVDATAPALAPGAFDAVLLDVPCSNSGVIRRRPDVRWHFSQAQVDELAILQAAILAGAAPLVRPGGRLVYSTCSLEPCENAEQVQRFLSRHPAFALVTERLLMPTSLHDGAYAALLRRRQ